MTRERNVLYGYSDSYDDSKEIKKDSSQVEEKKRIEGGQELIDKWKKEEKITIISVDPEKLESFLKLAKTGEVSVLEISLTPNEIAGLKKFLHGKKIPIKNLVIDPLRIADLQEYYKDEVEEDDEDNLIIKDSQESERLFYSGYSKCMEDCAEILRAFSDYLETASIPFTGERNPKMASELFKCNRLTTLKFTVLMLNLNGDIEAFDAAEIYECPDDVVPRLLSDNCEYFSQFTPPLGLKLLSVPGDVLLDETFLGRLRERSITLELEVDPDMDFDTKAIPADIVRITEGNNLEEINEWMLQALRENPGTKIIVPDSKLLEGLLKSLNEDFEENEEQIKLLNEKLLEAKKALEESMEIVSFASGENENIAENLIETEVIPEPQPTTAPSPTQTLPITGALAETSRK